MFFTNNTRIRTSDEVSPNNNVYLVAVRVYIAGVLVPVLNVNVTSGIENPATAEFSMPPYPELMQMGRRDRVPVQIFYKDTSYDDRLHLMFDGYITNVSYTSTAVNRIVTFNAMSWMKAFDDFNFLEVKELSGAFNMKTDGVANQGVVLNTALMPFMQLLLIRGLKEGGANIEVPCEYLSNIFKLIEQLGDKSFDTTNNKFEMSMYALYYRQLVTNLKMYNRLCGVACFDDDSGELVLSQINSKLAGKSALFPVLYGAQQKSAFDYVQAAISNSTAQSYNLLQIIQILMTTFDYEFLNISTPAYHTHRVKTLGTGPEIASLCFKPNLASAPYVPYCNIIFRTQALSIMSQEVFENTPTRVRLKNTQGTLATLCSNTSGNSVVSNVMLTDLYPKTKFVTEQKEGGKGFEVKQILSPDAGYTCKSTFADDLLDTEKYAGPHIADFVLPAWYDNYSASFAGDDGIASKKSIAERFMRKQLLESIYNVRSLVVSCVFDPYVQPGFPGAVFDGGDTGMSFAGYVTSVSHNFSQGEAGTTVTMSFVRTLEEAASVDIPNPVDTVNAITHKKEYFEKIVFSILGDGVYTDKVPSGAGNDKYDVPSTDINVGCNVMSFKKLYKMFTPVNTLDKNTNPQHSLPAAYAMQVRNVVTIEDYLKFYDMEVKEYMQTEDDLETPMVYSCNWITDRKKLNPYKNLWKDTDELADDDMMPHDEMYAPAKNLDTYSDTSTANSTTDNTNTTKYVDVTSSMDRATTGTDSVISKELSQQTNTGVITASAQQAETDLMEGFALDAEERKTYFSTQEEYAGRTDNVRVLLRSIADVEFYRKPYTEREKLEVEEPETTATTEEVYEGEVVDIPEKTETKAEEAPVEIPETPFTKIEANKDGTGRYMEGYKKGNTYYTRVIEVTENGAYLTTYADTDVASGSKHYESCEVMSDSDANYYKRLLEGQASNDTTGNYENMLPDTSSYLNKKGYLVDKTTAARKAAGLDSAVSTTKDTPTPSTTQVVTDNLSKQSDFNLRAKKAIYKTKYAKYKKAYENATTDKEKAAYKNKMDNAAAYYQACADEYQRRRDEAVDKFINGDGNVTKKADLY